MSTENTIQQSSIEPEEKLGGEALEEADWPGTLAEAVKILKDFVGVEHIRHAIEAPNKSDPLWGYAATRLGMADRNRGLLMDCLAGNRYKDKPHGIEMVAWVTVMSAAEGVFGEEKTERHKYRDVGRRKSAQGHR